MIFNSFNKIVLLIAMVLTVAISSNAKAEEFTRDDIKQIIREFVKEHPEEILQAIVEKSKNELKQKQDEALTTYKDQIFNDKNSPEAGNPKGDVTVVEFVDYNCGYCKKVAESVVGVLATDQNLRFIFKELPVLGDSSKEAAKWALAANLQGKYIEYHTALMQNRKAITTSLLIELATAVGLNVEQMQKDIKSDIVEKQIDIDYKLAIQMGLTGTPVFVVGDKLIMGAMMDGKLEQEIAEQRAKVKK